MSSSASYLDPVVLPLIVGASVLDVGCGYGRWGHLLRSNFWESGLAAPPTVDGIDAFLPNVELSRSGGAYRSVWQHVLPDPLDGAWDTVLACEVIEHVPQDAVEAALAVLEAAARRRVIVTTPSFPALRGGVETIVGFNEFDAHRSFVPASLFRARGYRLLGAGWGRPGNPLVDLATRLRLAPSLHSIVRRLPWLAETLVAVKDVG